MNEIMGTQVLLASLHERNRDASLRSLRLAGIALDQWDTKSLAKINDLTEHMDICDREINPDVSYTDTSYHLGSMLGFTEFCLQWSGRPISSYSYDPKGLSRVELAARAIVLPTQMLYVSLRSEYYDSARGCIVIAPDMPATVYDTTHEERQRKS